jgi:hypothetical protein
VCFELSSGLFAGSSGNCLQSDISSYPNVNENKNFCPSELLKGHKSYTVFRSLDFVALEARCSCFKLVELSVVV